MDEWFRNAWLLTADFGASRPLADTLNSAFGLRFRPATALLPEVERRPDALLVLDCATYPAARAHTLAATVCAETPCALLLANAAEDTYPDLVRFAGLKGMLPPPVSAATMQRALGALRRGELCFSRRLMSRRMDETRNRTPVDADFQRLTSREWRVLRLIVEGRPNAAIAAHLSLSPHTVKSHTQSIFRKINASNRTQAAHWARLHGPGQLSVVEELRGEDARTVA